MTCVSYRLVDSAVRRTKKPSRSRSLAWIGFDTKNVIESRFLSKVEIPQDVRHCWLWTGCKSAAGSPRPYRCMKCDRRFTAAGAKLPHTPDPRAKRAVICHGNVVIDGSSGGGHSDNVTTSEISATEPDRSAAPTVSQRTDGGAS